LRRTALYKLTRHEAAVTRPISEIGFWSGLAAFASTVAYVLVPLLQIAGFLKFPLEEIAIMLRNKQTALRANRPER
jgi:hypothetical protein